MVDTTPVIRRLRQANPEAEIDILTQYPGVYKNSPHRIGLFRQEVKYDRFIDLDMAFERHLRKVGVVESYMEVAFGDREGSTQLEMAYGPPPEFGLDWSLAITMHPARSWVHRTLPLQFWLDLASILASRGWIMLCIGTEQDWGFNGHRVLDLRERFDVQTQAAVISASRALRLFRLRADDASAGDRCTDRGHECTMSLPWIHERERHGIKGWRMYGFDGPDRLRRLLTSLPGTADLLRLSALAATCRVTLFDPLTVADTASRTELVKLQLADVTLVALDTVCHDLTMLAVKECMDKAQFGAVHVHTNDFAPYRRARNRRRAFFRSRRFQPSTMQ